MIWVAVLMVVAELVVQFIVAKKTNDAHRGDLAGGCFSLVVGAFMYRFAEIRILVIDGYSWEGRLSNYEEWTFFWNYFGLLMLLMGVVQIIFTFYKAYKDKESAK